MKASARRVEGRRLVYYKSRPTSDDWKRVWLNQPVEDYFRLAETGHLGFFERPFSKYLPRTGRVVEAGCGTGRYVLALRARGYDAEGVDISADTIDFIRSRKPDLPLRSGDIVALDVPDEYYAGYISLGVVEHFREGPDRCLQEAVRVLKIGGVALISVPHYNFVRRFKARLDCYDEDATRMNFYQYAFSEREFTEILTSAGFDVIDRHVYDGFAGLLHEFPPVGRLLYHPRWGRVVDRGIRFLFRHIAPLRRIGHMMLYVCVKSAAAVPCAAGRSG